MTVQLDARPDAAGVGGEPYPVVLPTPPRLPAGADPLTWRLAAVERGMRSAYFSLFSVPNPAVPDIPVAAQLPFPWSLLQRLPFFPELLSAVEVHEAPLRFQTTVDAAACQLLATNAVGQPIATVNIRWTPIPWDYPANPYTNPPQTILNPLVSQRFEMLNGQFRFDDSHDTGVHGFGSGRTFPRFPRGLSLDIGAVIDVLEGFGRFRGHSGLIVVNGMITPPKDLDLNIMVRILDPDGGLSTAGPLPPLAPRPFPDPTATFMMLLAEPDPERPSRLRVDAAGQVEGIELRQRLRTIGLDAAVLPRDGLRSQVRVGRVVGRARSTLHFPVSTSTVPVPAQTSGGEIELFDEALGLAFGTVRADLVEGRGLPTPLPEAPMPIYRVGGFGPILGGTGEFAGAAGMLSMNALLSLYPRTFSALYVLRFQDPQGRYRVLPGATLGGTWTDGCRQ
jgi:hypothetical protein